MKMLKSSLSLMLFVLFLGSFSVQAQDKSIVALTMENEDLSALALGIKQAGLTEALQAEGPFTVFAPKNSGFKDLSKIRLNTLMQPGMESQLKELLTSHVVSGNFSSADLKKAIQDGKGKLVLESLSGHPLTLVIDGKKIEIIDHQGEKSEVEMADIQASNGIVHVVDEVVIPMEMKAEASTATKDELVERGAPDAKVKNLVEMTSSLSNTTIAAKAIETTGLTKELRAKGSYTFFVPTDEAFTLFPAKKLNEMMQSTDQKEIAQLLKYHMIDNEDKVARLLDKTDWGEDAKQYKTVAGEKITLELKNGEFILTDPSGNNARVVSANIPATNGVIYLIDGVLTPKEGMKYQNKEMKKEEMKKDQKDKKKSDKMKMKKEEKINNQK